MTHYRGSLCLFLWVAATMTSPVLAFRPSTGLQYPKHYKAGPEQQQQRRHDFVAHAAADAWTGGGSNGSYSSSSSTASSGGGFGAVEQIEFKIYPDGRVEETVRGVKGNNCHQVTERINEKLGEVVATRPTEEMFEQEVKVTQTLYQTDASGDWEGSSSW